MMFGGVSVLQIIPAGRLGPVGHQPGNAYRRRDGDEPQAVLRMAMSIGHEIEEPLQILRCEVSNRWAFPQYAADARKVNCKAMRRPLEFNLQVALCLITDE